MTRSFSFNGLWRVVRWDVASGWRGYLAGLWAAASLLLLMFIVNSRVIGGSLVALTDAQSMGYKADLVLSAFVFAMVCGASFATLGLGDKSRRAAFFMLPATQLEKFVARCLQFTVGVAVLLVAAVAVADALHMVYCLVVGTNGGLHSVLALFARQLAEAVSEPFVRELAPRREQRGVGHLLCGGVRVAPVADACRVGALHPLSVCLHLHGDACLLYNPWLLGPFIVTRAGAVCLLRGGRCGAAGAHSGRLRAGLPPVRAYAIGGAEVDKRIT